MKPILILITLVLLGACERRPGDSGIDPEYQQRQEEQKNRTIYQKQMEKQNPILEKNYED